MGEEKGGKGGKSDSGSPKEYCSSYFNEKRYTTNNFYLGIIDQCIASIGIDMIDCVESIVRTHLSGW